MVQVVLEVEDKVHQEVECHQAVVWRQVEVCHPVVFRQAEEEWVVHHQETCLHKIVAHQEAALQVAVLQAAVLQVVVLQEESQEQVTYSETTTHSEGELLVRLHPDI